MPKPEPIDFTKQYVEDFLSFFGLNIDVSVEQEDETISVDIPSTRLNGFLIGRGGSTLRSIQYLTNLAVKSQEFDRDVNVVVDIAGYKAKRVERLKDQAEDVARQVKKEDQAQPMEPMNSFERRAVHRAVADIAGVTTHSQDQGRDRHVVVSPADEESEEE